MSPVGTEGNFPDPFRGRLCGPVENQKRERSNPPHVHRVRTREREPPDPVERWAWNLIEHGVSVARERGCIGQRQAI